VFGVSCDSGGPAPTREPTRTTGGQALDVNTQGGSNSRQQAVHDEALTYATVSSARFQYLTKLDVRGNIYAQPLSTTIPDGFGGQLSIILVATTENLLYAFNARPPFNLQWGPIPFGTPADFLNGTKPYAQNYQSSDCRSNVGRVGILSTPVVSGGFAYLVAETELPGGNDLAHTLYKVNLSDGTLANPVQGQRISATGHNSFFQSNIQLQRPGLLASGGAIYAAFGSHCDATTDDYTGWVIAFDASDLHALSSYCTTCQAALQTGVPKYPNQGGIWQSGSGLATDSQGNVLFMVGNGKSMPDDPGTTIAVSSFLFHSPRPEREARRWNPPST
jgi:hypothetical protein